MITDELDTVMEWYTISVDTHKSMKLAGIVKQIYQYRNWVAHGKRPEKTPAKTDPVSAYRHLSEFLCRLKKSLPCYTE
ncbi:hypothetical protein [Virgibacillus ainsalahensis]